MIQTSTVLCVKFARKLSGTETNYETTLHIIKWNFTDVSSVQKFTNQSVPLSLTRKLTVSDILAQSASPLLNLKVP